MTPEIQDLEFRLSAVPDDWSLRIRLIEERVRRNEMDAARRLVRESPDTSPLPYELQHRLHTLMTRGAAALAAHVGGESSPAQPVSREAPPGIPAKTNHEAPLDRREIPKGIPLQKSPLPDRNSVPETEVRENAKEDQEKEGAKVPGQGIRKKIARGIGVPQVHLKEVRERKEERWRDYQGDFILETPRVSGPQKRPPNGPRKISALSMALLFHIVFLILVGFIVIHLPRPRPPVLIASVVTHDRPAELLPTRITPRSREVQSAAAAAAAQVIGSTGPSPVAVPEIERSQGADVTTLITGIRTDGRGLSYTANAREMSDVNFFGISAGGKRIVFLVDAGRYMLVDERGGMFAYDKVKNEIGLMLAGLNRGTFFNLLLFDGERLLAFREDLVPALPSNLRLAVEWMDPVNRVYEELGLRGQPGVPVEVSGDVDPIQTRDLAHYTKAIQKSLEWGAGAIFCITGDYFRLNRSLTPEMIEKMRDSRDRSGEDDSAAQVEARKAWNEARQKTMEWLQKENQARAAKGISPKVVTDFVDLVRKVTGMTPPRPTGGMPGGAPGNFQMPGPYTPQDIEDQIQNSVRKYFRNESLDPPSIHIVLFLGEDQEIQPDEADHFKNLTRKNRGKLKILRGLAALQDVTGTGTE